MVQGKQEKADAKILREVQPHDILKYGIIPELVGRLPVIAPLDGLNREELVRVLQEPKNALVKQYQKLFSYDNVNLVFEQGALEAIADKAIERKIGARGLRAVMEGLLTDIMYEIPSEPSVDEVRISAACVRGEEAPTVHHSSSRELPKAE